MVARNFWRFAASARLPVFFCTLVLVAGAGFAQTRILVAVNGNSSDPRLAAIVSRTAALEAERSGLTAVTREGAQGSSAPGDLTAAARNAGAPVLLRATYQEQSAGLELKMALIRVDGGSTIGETAVSLEINLDLDARLSAVFHTFFTSSSVADYLKTVAQAEPQTAARSAPEPVAPPAATRPASPAPKAESPPTPTTTPTPARPQTTPTAPPAPQTVPETRAVSGFTFSIGGAPLLLVGTASDIFRYGIRIDASAEYRFPLLHAVASTGLEIGATRIFPVSDAVQGTVYVMSAGPVFRIGTSGDSPASVFLKLTGGPAVLTAQVSGGQLLAKTLISAEGALSARLRLGPRLLLSADIGYLTVFEPSSPVMGLVPGISLVFEP